MQAAAATTAGCNRTLEHHLPRASAQAVRCSCASCPLRADNRGKQNKHGKRGRECIHSRRLRREEGPNRVGASTIVTHRKRKLADEGKTGRCTVLFPRTRGSPSTQRKQVSGSSTCLPACSDPLPSPQPLSPEYEGEGLIHSKFG